MRTVLKGRVASGFSKRRLLLGVGRVVLLSVLFISLYIMFFEKRLIYYPEREFVAAPSNPFTEVSFEAVDGVRLHGWWIRNDASSRLLIVSHGNAGNISYRAEMADFLHDELGVTVFLYDYRGYGRSEGSPSEQGTYADLRGAYRHSRAAGYEPEAIFLLGQSLGSAIAVDLAAEETVGGVILEAPFTSVRGIARAVSPLPLGVLLRTRYDSLSKIGTVKSRFAFVHALEDPVVPYVLGRELFDAATSTKRFWDVSGALHEGALMGLGISGMKDLRDFLFNERQQ